MRLLLVSGDSSVAEGKQSTFRRVLESFRTGWNRIDVVLPPTSSEVQVTQFDNVFLHVNPGRKSSHLAFVADRVSSLLEAHGHELVSAHIYGLCLHGIGARIALRRSATDTRFMVEIHHVPGVPRSGGLRDLVEKELITRYIRWASSHVDAIRVVNAHEVPSYLVNICGVPAEKVVNVPSVFVDHEAAQLTDAPKVYDLMFCGRLMPNKGLDLLLATLQEVRRYRPEATLLVKSSGGTHVKWLKQEVMRLKLEEAVTVVEWVESPSDLARLYSQSRVFICTSYNEGGPRVTVEAMACATPVVSTRVGIMPDIIQRDVNGFLADWNPVEIAQHCLRLLEDELLARRVGVAGYETVRPMTREKVIQRYVEVYQAVAQGRPTLVM
jgi:glycosyltransferase involved in cell wall biosynthesis